MLVLQSTWRYLVVSATLGMISLALGCGGKTPVNAVTTPVYTVSGTVKYTRVPLVKDPVSGVPTGLETDPAKFLEMPARGILVRAIQGKDEIDATGTTVKVWRVVGSTLTTSTGNYTLSVQGESPTYVEVMGVGQFGSSNQLQIIATDIASSLPILDRPLYVLRKGADGTSSGANPAPGAILTSNSSVNFDVGLDSTWWISPSSPSLVRNSTLETIGSGSRILGILDSAYSFESSYGDATPGATLHLHYQKGAPWNFGTRASFVEFDTTVYPAAFNGGSLNFFGAIRSDSSLDDTWNEATLFSLFARNWIVRQGISGVLPTQSLPDRTDLQDLAPGMAVHEGFVQAIASILMKSPYLSQKLSSPTVVRDIRIKSGLGSDAYSAANIAALAWEVALKCDSLPSPGTPVDWEKIKPASSIRFFTAILLQDSNNYPSDIVSIYSQIARLRETKGSTETIDLGAIFTDATLTTLLSPFGLTWPRPTAGVEACYLMDWGKDPNTAVTPIPAFTLSMANAHLNGESTAVYPNYSKGEVLHARFLLSRDRKYRLTIQNPDGTLAVVPATAKIEVLIGNSAKIFSSLVSTADDFWLLGNATTPIYHQVRVRLLSPSVQQPDLPITLGLVALN